MAPAPTRSIRSRSTSTSPAVRASYPTACSSCARASRRARTDRARRFASPSQAAGTPPDRVEPPEALLEHRPAEAASLMDRTDGRPLDPAFVVLGVVIVDR